MTKRARKKLSPMAEEIKSRMDTIDAGWKASIPAM